MNFIENIFVERNHEFSHLDCVMNDDTYKIGQFIEILPYKLFGQIKYFYVKNGENLVRIQLNKDQINNLPFHSKIDRLPDNKLHSIIVMKKHSVKNCSEKLEFLNETLLINQNSIQYKIQWQLKKFEKNEIIKVGKDINKKYFIIIESFIINGLSCLSITEPILGSVINYIRVIDAMKVDESELEIKYFQEVFIDPKSILSFKKCESDDLSIGNHVEIKSNNYNVSYRGIIKFIGIANNTISSCVVQLYHFTNEIDEKVSQYSLNKYSEFQNLCDTTGGLTLLIPTCVSKKLNLFEKVNGLLVLNPKFIKDVKGKEVQEKYITFESNNDKFFVKLKWLGAVDLRYCFGCEVNYPLKFGTNGIFEHEKLFTCKENQGILIPIDSVSKCCEFDEHKPIKLLKDNVIDENSICCIMDKRISRIQIDRRVIKIKDNNIGTCRWSGLMNDVEVIGVEMKEALDNGTNGIFCGLKLFNCKSQFGAVFRAVEFKNVKSKLKFLNDIGLYIVDPLNIRDIENECQIEKSTYYKIKGATKIINIKWRGTVDGQLCVGCELANQVEYGTDGTFINVNLFKCKNKSGVLIFTDELKDSCEATTHLEIVTHPDRCYFSKENTGFINPDCICCIQPIESLKKHPRIRIGSTIKLSKESKAPEGICKWIGLINDKEAAGVAMDDYVNGTNGIFKNFHFFACKNGKGVLILAENIVYDGPFVQKFIPEEERIFKDININSAVKYYFIIDNKVIDLYGTVKWTGMDEYNHYYYGLELDDRISYATDGIFSGQRLFDCENGHGMLAPISCVVHDTRFVERNVSPGNIRKSAICDQFVYGINSTLTEGNNKGIQGNSNTSHFDSAIFALFSKSDVLEYLISPVINEHEQNSITKEFRNIVAWKIVYPLRKNGFVSFHHTNEMENVIQNYGDKFAKVLKQETDMENVFALLSKLCPTEQLLSIIGHKGDQNNLMILELFLTVDRKVRFMTTEQMLKISMLQNEMMLNKLPTCLIVQAARIPRGTHSYKYALPLKEIEISKVCSNYFKKCYKCDKEAVFQCKICLKDHLDITCTFQCPDHKCRHSESIKLRYEKIKSKSKVFMELQGIICIENSHIVCFVKQMDKVNKDEWFSFDNMSSQSTRYSSYTVPKVSFAKSESEFLRLSENEMINKINCYPQDNLKRILKSSSIFIYHNRSKTCY